MSCVELRSLDGREDLESLDNGEDRFSRNTGLFWIVDNFALGVF